jgi:hypothetical protein
MFDWLTRTGCALGYLAEYTGFAELAAKLFDKGVSDRQIVKAPVIMWSVSPKNCPTVLRLNLSQLMKLHDLPAQFDIQAIRNDFKFDDVRVSTLVYRCLPNTTRITPSRAPPRRNASAQTCVAPA